MRVAVAGSTGLVGRRLSARLRDLDHTVVGISRADGIDLTAPDSRAPVAARLRGVDVVVDVTNVLTQDLRAATTWFTTVARTLGAAADEAGVARTVVLSIIGVDGLPHDAHYAGKLAQERAHATYAADLHVVRAAHFHEFPAMVLQWSAGAETVPVGDFPLQPVDLDVVVDALVAAATARSAAAGSVVQEVAGPRPERLVDLVARLVRARGAGLDVVATPASPELRAGACLPGPDALVAGPTFDEWLARCAAPLP